MQLPDVLFQMILGFAQDEQLVALYHALSGTALLSHVEAEISARLEMTVEYKYGKHYGRHNDGMDWWESCRHSRLPQDYRYCRFERDSREDIYEIEHRLCVLCYTDVRYVV